MRRAIRERVQRWNNQWRELGARHRVGEGERQYQERLRELRREGQELQSEGGELDSNPDEEPPSPPTSRPASERRSGVVPDQDRHREGGLNEGRRSTNLDPNGHAPSDRSGDREGSSGRSENPPSSDPPSYASDPPSYHTNASMATNLPSYDERPTLFQQLEMPQDRRRHDDPFDRQRSAPPRREG